MIAALSLGLSACGVASEVLNHEANDQRLLKSGALDIGVAPLYDTYNFNFLNKYRIAHAYISTDKCHYANDNEKSLKTKRPLPYYGYDFIYETLPIYEIDNHTLQAYTNDPHPKKLDRYTLPEYIQGTDSKGNPMIAKGFNPICFESWGGTSHTLVVKLYKQDVATWRQKLTKANPDGKFKEETIGGNTWLVQTNPIAERRINSTGGAFLHYTTAIADTGYTLTMQLGANQDSLQHPQAHAQMQAIFKHLIESVKIEPIK